MDIIVALEGYNASDPFGHLRGLDYFELHPVLTYCYLVIMSVSTAFGVIGNLLVSDEELAVTMMWIGCGRGTGKYD